MANSAKCYPLPNWYFIYEEEEQDHRPCNLKPFKTPNCQIMPYISKKSNCDPLPDLLPSLHQILFSEGLHHKFGIPNAFDHFSHIRLGLSRKQIENIMIGTGNGVYNIKQYFSVGKCVKIFFDNDKFSLQPFPEAKDFIFARFHLLRNFTLSNEYIGTKAQLTLLNPSGYCNGSQFTCEVSFEIPIRGLPGDIPQTFKQAGVLRFWFLRISFQGKKYIFKLTFSKNLCKRKSINFVEKSTSHFTLCTVQCRNFIVTSAFIQCYFVILAWLQEQADKQDGNIYPVVRNVKLLSYSPDHLNDDQIKAIRSIEHVKNFPNYNTIPIPCQMISLIETLTENTLQIEEYLSGRVFGDQNPIYQNCPYNQ